ncbi:zinc finger protein 532 isoform X1 [Nasonia vitripennis]|uniref:C2H2-type domain-containing protein n=2 Tax=Nasonia vitripennis TaxID=7425 RepID=A0A7M7IQU8_NASVI|nr:zinc finger protein 532 isoform X1 [Nasonia vitripennis]
MSKRMPNILKRREAKKGIPVTQESNTTTALNVNSKINVIVLKVIPDKVSNSNQDFLNGDICTDSSNDSDIEVISSSIKEKKNTAKSITASAKYLKTVLKGSKAKLKNVASILKETKTESRSIKSFLVPEQSKPCLMLTNHTVSRDKITDDEAGILVENLRDSEKSQIFCKSFENNENLLHKIGENASRDFFQPNDQINNTLESEENVNIVTPQSIEETESNITLKQFKNKFKVTKQSNTLMTLRNDTDLKDQTIDDETGISFEDLVDLADDEKFPCINDKLMDDGNALKNSSKNCLSPTKISNCYVDPENYDVNNVTFQLRDKDLVDNSDGTKHASSRVNSVADDEADISKTNDVLHGISDDSISNSDSYRKGFVDSLPPKDDPSIINNAPLNITSVGNTLLSTDDTESLNSLVRLKCTNCLTLVQCPEVEPQMECQKCCLKYQYQCKICTSGFVSLYSLYTHLIKFHSRGEAVHSLIIKPQYVKKPRQIKRLQCDSTEIYNCQKCGSVFKLETIKNKHEAICSRNPKLNCPFCSLAMSFKKNLKEHMIKLHSESFEMNEVDGIINQIVKDGNKKRRDEKAASLLQMLQVAYCRKCDRRTPVHELLNGEMNCAICSENFVFTCTDPQCSRIFPTAKALSSHARMLHIEKRDHYRCAHCLYATTSSRDLIRHQKDCGDLVILPPRLFVCPNCDKSFKKERYLQVHLQRPETCARNKQRELVCPKCNRTFRMQHWLQNHRCESVTTPLELSEPTLPMELSSTELVPLQEPEYPCPDCGKVFKQMRWFNAHKEKYCYKQRVLYRCAHCRYQGFEKKKLKVHIRCAHIHLCTGKKLRCVKCGTKWTSIYSLNRHLDNCSGDYETERVKMRRKKKKSWEEMFGYV